MNKNYKINQSYIQRVVKETVPIMRYDGVENFETWRERAAEKLYDLLGLPFGACDDLFEIIAETDCGDFKRIDFTFQSEEGYFVPASLLIPKTAHLPLPTAICIQGHTTGMHISLGIEKYPGDDKSIAGGRNFAERAIQEGCCAVVLEQRYMGVCGQNDMGVPACVTRNAALPSLLMGRTAIGERVWDVQRLIDVIVKYFSEYVEMEQIICIGNSGGGTVTFYAACMDARIKLAVPSCAVCEFEDSIVPINHCGCNYIPGIRKYFEMGDIGGLIAPRKLVVVCGVQDTDFPLQGVEKSYERIKAVYRQIGMENDCRIVKGKDGHQFYADLVWPVINELMSR